MLDVDVAAEMVIVVVAGAAAVAADTGTATGGHPGKLKKILGLENARACLLGLACLASGAELA